MKLRVVRLPALAAVAVALAIVGGCDSGPGMMMREQAVSRNFDSNGERIYFTGRSRSGPAITFSGGNMHLRMMGGGCTTCHGDDREGGIRMMPRFWVVAPALTRDALFEDHGDDGHGDHDRYTEASLRRAISEGLDAGGEPLAESMPRWSMDERQLEDLLEYLRS
jgi:mono/diheme cytochrome c family protein